MREGYYVGLGAMLRDEEGHIVAVAVKRASCTMTEIAEAKAAEYVVQLALRLGYRDVEVESDSVNVIQAVNSTRNDLTPVHLVYDYIRLGSMLFDVCSFKHIKRHCNTAAHLVARWDADECSEFV